MDNVIALLYNDYGIGDIGMLQVRIDDETKNKASALFEEMGIDLSTAVRIFLKKCLAVGGLPFEMNVSKTTIEAIVAADEMRRISKENGNDKMSLDEINEIISETRKNRK